MKKELGIGYIDPVDLKSQIEGKADMYDINQLQYHKADKYKLQDVQKALTSVSTQLGQALLLILDYMKLDFNELSSPKHILNSK